MRNIDADRPRKVQNRIKEKRKNPSDLELGIFEVVQSGLLVNLPGKKVWKRVVLFLYISQHKRNQNK